MEKLVWVPALIFLFMGVVVLVKSSWNVGSLAIWGLAVVFTLWALFPAQVAAFTASGLGFWLMVLFWGKLAFLAGLVVFLAISGRRGGATGEEKAMVVLGAGLQGSVVSDMLERRLLEALRAYEKNPALLVVVSGGQGRGEDIPEAVAMRRWLVARGLPEERVLAECESTSTETNLRFSREVLKAHGVEAAQPVLVVTNTFHCYRARCYAKRAGFLRVHSQPASMNRFTRLQNYLREALAVQYLWCFRR